MTPRALAPDSIALLLPLSCHAMAAASELGAPCCAAMEPIWPEVRRPGEATGGAAGTIVRAGAGVVATTGEPVGSLMTVPASSGLLGSRPFMNAICATGTRLRAASALKVSPGRTLYAPIGAGAADVMAAGAAEAPAPPAAGRCRVVPASSGRLGSRPLTAARRESETPLRAAMALSVSPQRTCRPPPDGAGALAAGVLVVAGAADVRPAAGIVNVVPAT